jgi:hypothetical protein
MQARVSNMSQLDAKELRLAMRGTDLLTPTLAIIQRANQVNMPVLLVVLPDPSDYADPNGALANAGSEFDSLCGWPTGQYRVSQVDAGRFAARMSAYVNAILGQGLQVEAFEIGNEYDWTCFNGDVPLSGAMSSSDFHASYSSYAEMLKVAAETVRAAYPSCAAPMVLTFGMANTLTWRGQNNGAVDPLQIYALLQNVNGQNYVSSYADAIGQHLYYTDMQTNLAALQGAASALSSPKPIWVTEWGVSTAAYPAGSARYAMFQEFLSLFTSHPELDIAKTFLYAYDDAPYNIYDDGTGQALPDAHILSDYNK